MSTAGVVVLSPAELKAIVREAVQEALAGRVDSSDTLPLRACGVSVRTLRAAIAAGELAAVKAGREYRVRRADLDAWLATLAVSPKPCTPANDVASKPSATPADRAIARALGAG